MMMAFDSSQTPPSRLDEGIVSDVRAALRAYIAEDDPTAALPKLSEVAESDTAGTATTVIVVEDALELVPSLEPTVSAPDANV